MLSVASNFQISTRSNPHARTSTIHTRTTPTPTHAHLFNYRPHPCLTTLNLTSPQPPIEPLTLLERGRYIAQIAAFPKSNEKRVVSYGLYGSNPKYIDGAVRNSELVKIYFPGWVCRFYVDGTVPQPKIAELTANGAEIIPISNIKGGIAGMFWRFMVADDNTVAQFITKILLKFVNHHNFNS